MCGLGLCLVLEGPGPSHGALIRLEGPWYVLRSPDSSCRALILLAKTLFVPRRPDSFYGALVVHRGPGSFCGSYIIPAVLISASRDPALSRGALIRLAEL